MKLSLVQGWISCLILSVFILFCFSCEDHNRNGDPELVYATESDFSDSLKVAVELAPGFQMKLWAAGALLANPVAISIDNQGAAYITETQRRKSSDLDIRAHRNWMVEDLALQSLEDTREFHQRKLDPELSDQNQWLEDFNQDGSHDWRDLTVQSEYVRKIWDSNGDGRADVGTVFAGDMNDMLTGVAAGVMYQDGNIFVTAAPDVYRFTDRDSDGDSDEREVISHGFGIHIAYAGHDMSGLVMGPDGKVYWSVGDIGVNAKSKEGKQFYYPNQGAVMRANPDGSDFEVYAHGLRNPQELAFDAYGNLISVDNDGDHPGEHERFVHILEGSDTGWRINWQFGKYNQPNEGYKVWMDEKLHIPHFPGQAAYILPALALAPDGPAGLAYQPGSALSDQWHNYFFGSYFKGSAAKSKLQAFRLEPKGASFEVAETKDILSGIVSTGLAFGPDGALYVNDWLEGYEKKPSARIWKLDVANANQTKRKETQGLLADGMSDRSKSDLKNLLGHVDMRVRMAAQFELAKQKDSKTLLEALSPENPELVRIHAVWGLGQLARTDGKFAQDLLQFLDDSNPEVKAQTAKVLGDASYQPASESLLSILNDSAPRVQYFAAEALGKIGYQPAFEPIANLIANLGETDPHLRHGLIHALYRMNMEEELIALSNHASRSLRIGAVVALRKMRSPGLKEFLQDQDTLVLMEAARAINDDLSVPEAIPALAAALTSAPTTNEVFIRRAINANLRIGDDAAAQRLAQYAANQIAPLSLREDALWALGYWEKPPVLDWVDGRYRKLPERAIKPAQDAFASVALQILESNQTGIRTAAVQAVGRLKYQPEEQRIVRITLDQRQPSAVRRAALQSLADLQSNQIESVLRKVLVDKNLELRTDAQGLMGTLGLPPATVVELLTRVLNNSTVPERQQALESLGRIDHPAANELLFDWLERLIGGNLELPVQLDLIMAIENSEDSGLKARLAEYQKSRENAPVLDRYRETLMGGDINRGRRLFLQDNSAQCIRCHILGEYGGEVGPILNGIASELSREQLLEAMIDPSARLAPGYGTVTLTLSNGEKVTGVLEKETAESLTVRTADGISQTISQREVQDKNYTPSSMPSMQGVLTKDEIRDLVAFLVEQK